MIPSDRRRLITEIFGAALRAVDPHELVAEYAERICSVFQGGDYNRCVAVGFGKAACPMTKALEDRLCGSITGGVAITKYGHCRRNELRKVSVHEAGHPVPDENGVKGTEEIIRLLRDADEKSLVVYLVSGGGSALLVSPCEGLTLKEKQAITELLLKAGADIDELNTVRKHLSRVKGGRLAEIAYPARQISLILSDVIGDRLDVIASGPTSPDRTTFHGALRVLEKYGLESSVPEAISELFRKGARGLIPETLKEGDEVFGKIENIIIGSNRKALGAAKRRAESLDLRASMLPTEISGEAREAGRQLARTAMEAKNRKPLELVCLLSGGETTVTVKGKGLGGRNMELALAFAVEIDGIDGIYLLSAGTDGTDGPTDAAGAIVDGKTVGKATAIGLDPEEYLNDNDSYGFFKQTGELLTTGPTGTNVMDIQIVVVE